MRVYKVMLPRIGRDSAINYPLSHLMLHVLGVRTPSRLQFFFRTVCMLPLQTCLSLGQDTPPLRVTSEPLCSVQYLSSLS